MENNKYTIQHLKNNFLKFMSDEESQNKTQWKHKPSIPRRKNNILNIGLLLLFIFSSFLLTGYLINRIINNTDQSNTSSQKKIIRKNSNKKLTYDELKSELQKIETNTPLNFLKFKVKNHRGGFFASSTYYINGEIENNAELSTYKDLIVEIVFYSRTKSILRREYATIYKLFPPKKTTKFQKTVNNIPDLDSLHVSIVNIIPALTKNKNL